MEANKEKKFELDNKLDDMGCTPKCASHQTFGLVTMDLTSCEKCNFVDDINEVQHAYLQQFYVDEILHLRTEILSKEGKSKMNKNQQQNSLPFIMNKIMKNESDFHI